MTPVRSTVRATALAVVAGVAAVALAGCGGSSDGAGRTTPSASASASGGTATTAPTTTDPATGSDTPSGSPSTGASTPGGGSSAPGTPAPPSCAGLTVAVQRVSGGGGYSYALVTVTNAGSATCRLDGAPELQLLDASGAAVGPASVTIGTGTPVDLAPGSPASTLLEDASSTCSAPSKSTSVRVGGPGISGTPVFDLAFTPCTLQVKPYVAGTTPAPSTAQ